MQREIRRFHVGLKALIERQGKLLLVQESDGELWELPGGRIDVGEEQLPLHKILTREIQEELGEKFHVQIGKLLTAWVRAWRGGQDYVFLVGYQCQYVAGEPIMSAEHSNFGWFGIDEITQIPLAEGYDVAIQAWIDLHQA